MNNVVFKTAPHSYIDVFKVLITCYTTTLMFEKSLPQENACTKVVLIYNIKFPGCWDSTDVFW